MKRLAAYFIVATVLFQAAIEATEEAILNSLFKATTVTGNGKTTINAIPINETLTILRKCGKIK